MIEQNKIILILVYFQIFVHVYCDIKWYMKSIDHHACAGILSDRNFWYTYNIKQKKNRSACWESQFFIFGNRQLGVSQYYQIKLDQYVLFRITLDRIVPVQNLKKRKDNNIQLCLLRHIFSICACHNLIIETRPVIYFKLGCNYTQFAFNYKCSQPEIYKASHTW